MKYIIAFLLLSLSAHACAEYAEAFTPIEIPSGIPYTNERVNVYVNGTYYASVIVEDKVVTSFSCDMISDVTYNVYLDSEDVLTATYASVDEVMQLVTDGTVVVEPQTFVSNVKYTISKLALRVVSWFW